MQILFPFWFYTSHISCWNKKGIKQKHYAINQAVSHAIIWAMQQKKVLPFHTHNSSWGEQLKVRNTCWKLFSAAKERNDFLSQSTDEVNISKHYLSFRHFQIYHLFFPICPQLPKPLTSFWYFCELQNRYKKNITTVVTTYFCMF